MGGMALLIFGGVFLAVARGGTLLKAGKDLNINASTAHRRIEAEKVVGRNDRLADQYGHPTCKLCLELGETVFVPHDDTPELRNLQIIDRRQGQALDDIQNAPEGCVVEAAGS